MDIWNNVSTRSASLPKSHMVMNLFPKYVFTNVFGMSIVATSCPSYTSEVPVIKIYLSVSVVDGTPYFDSVNYSYFNTRDMIIL